MCALMFKPLAVQCSQFGGEEGVGVGWGGGSKVPNARKETVKTTED